MKITDLTMPAVYVDPNIDPNRVPKEVITAAQLINTWAVRNGITHFQLMGIESRDYQLIELKALNEELAEAKHGWKIASDSVHRLQKEIREQDAQLAAANAEIERLRSGGCARNQHTTQFCAEAVAANERIKELEEHRGKFPVMDAKWLDPECHKGCQSLAWKAEAKDYREALDAAKTLANRVNMYFRDTEGCVTSLEVFSALYDFKAVLQKYAKGERK